MKAFSDPIRERDVNILKWIHSNRFTDLSLFGFRFSKSGDISDYARALNRLKEKGLLIKYKRGYNEEPVYTLSEAALSRLSKDGVILVKSYEPPKISWNCMDHDKRVIRIRAEIEKNIEAVFWVSDFEMRSGVMPKTKADFIEGKLDVLKWRYNRGMTKERLRRTPDAYFEATVNGVRSMFVLEYVHADYSSRKYDEIIPRLIQRFTGSIKLLVFRDSEVALKNIQELKRRINDREGWWAGSYESIIQRPFLEAFEDLKG